MNVTDWTGRRSLGRSGIEVSALGFGCWAVAGPWQTADGAPMGWGDTDDDESIGAIRRAADLGVTFFDTADVYGCGHGERLLGRALAGRRDEVVIATKWGYTFEADTRVFTGADTSPEYQRRALEGSLRRLGTDHVDLYQFHVSDAAPEAGAALRDAAEDLVAAGLIRGYAWSTDDPERARVFAAGPHCTAVQHELSVLHDAPDLLALCAAENLASVNRTPLAMGLLTGKYGVTSQLGGDDIRSTPPPWLRYFTGSGAAPGFARRVEAVRGVLTRDGRSLAQGALGWLWARAPQTVPIPGMRTVQQVEQNVGAVERGPLDPDQLAEIGRLLTPADLATG